MTKAQEDQLSKGEILPIMEHFYTLQGEGMYAGEAACFIRLGGCTVGCHWCDVKESWNYLQHELHEIKSIAKMASEVCKKIIITGGEPLMWNLTPLTSELKKMGCSIHIETSGSEDITGVFDWITLSPKKAKLPKEEVYKRADELKVIVFNNHDFIFAQEQAKKVSKNCRLYLQSEWSKKNEMYPKITRFILENPEWSLSVQIHKYLDIP